MPKPRSAPKALIAERSVEEERDRIARLNTFERTARAWLPKRELGGDFSVVGWQRRLRIDQTWYRIDLLFFHCRLRCLVIVDLKLGGLTHADVGPMHMYCNYAKENWTLPDENPPVGLILCADKGTRWLDTPSKIMAANYRTVLPDAEVLQGELEKTRRMLDVRGTFRENGRGGDRTSFPKADESSILAFSLPETAKMPANLMV